MKISNRELVLGWSTGMALLLAFTYWLAQPRLAAWREQSAYQKALNEQITHAQRLVDQRAEWMERLDKLRAGVAAHPADRDVTADYLRLLERLAGETGLTLIQRKAQKEKSFGDLLELVIDCTWESNLESLVRFIYAMEKEPSTMDMEDLTISLVSGAEDRMKGSFSVICIYSRLPAGAATNTPPVATNTPPATTNAGAATTHP